MNSLSPWIVKILVNAVPILGLTLGGWDGATVLTLYWLENLLDSLLVALRIVLHRRATQKAGHWRPQLGVQATSGGKPVRFHTFVNEFLVGSLVLTAGHGLLLAALLGMVFQHKPSLDELRSGALVIAGIQAVGFLIDLPGLRERSFAWVRELATVALGRVVLVHLAVLGGAAWFAWRGEGAFLPFALLKMLADLGSITRLAAKPASLGGFAAMLGRLPGGRGFESKWERRQVEELALAAADEEPRRQLGLARSS